MSLSRPELKGVELTQMDRLSSDRTIANTFDGPAQTDTGTQSTGKIQAIGASLPPTDLFGPAQYLTVADIPQTQPNTPMDTMTKRPDGPVHQQTVHNT